MKLSRHITCIFIGILLITAVYVNTFHNAFQFDDIIYILGSERIKSLSNLPQILTDIFSRPLLLATFALNYSIGGVSPIGYHLVNIALHISVSILIYLILLYTLEKDAKSHLLPFSAALIFALHPMNTESVTYIISRSSVLSAFFYLLSLFMFIKANKRGSGVRSQESEVKSQEKLRLTSHDSQLMTLFYLLSSGFFFILALGSKEDAVTLPIIVLFYYLFFISTTRNGLSPFRNNLKIILPFILLASIYPIVRYFKLGMAGIGDATGIFTPLTYLITELNVIIFYYLRLLFFPINLNVDPDIRPINSLFSLSTLISMVIIFLIVIVSYKFFRRDPIISFAIMWFFVTLMPTSSVFPLWDPAAEHRVYLPAVGFSIFLARLIGKIGTKTRFFPSTYFMSWVRMTNLVLCLFISILLSFSLCTIKRNFIWKDRVSLWEDTVKKSPLKARPHAALGLAYNYEKGLIDDAIRQYRIALGIKPFFFDALNNLGIALDMKGELDGAMQKYQIALMMKPYSPEIHNNIAIIYAKKGEISKAEAEFKRSLEIAPDYIKAKKNLEMLSKGMADFEGSTAVDRYR